MTTTLAPSRRIAMEVATWPGTSATPGAFGSTSFRVGRREIGHLHGDHAAHFAFPRAVRDELMRRGRVTPHPALPDSPGLAARRIAGDDDVRDVVAMLRMNYERLAARRPGAVTGAAAP